MKADCLEVQKFLEVERQDSEAMGDYSTEQIRAFEKMGD